MEKKIISVFLCICLMSGCGKSLNHGRPANDVVGNTGSEAKPPLPSDISNASAPEPSNTPAPTPEPSKSVLPLSDSAASSDLISWHWWFPTINLSNSVLYWTLNSVGYAVALALVIVGCYDLFRYFKPEKRDTSHKVAGSIYLSSDQVIDELNNDRVYSYCSLFYRSDSSYTWYFAKRVTECYFFVDEREKKIDSKIPVYQLRGDYYRSERFKFNVYIYQLNLAT